MEPETLYCDECGNPTHDDTSEIWVSLSDGKPHSRVCYNCAPPDEPDYL